MSFEGTHTCGSINGYVIYEAHIQRFMAELNGRIFGCDVTRTLTLTHHITFLFNFRDNLGKWCRTFGRRDTNFSMCKPSRYEEKNHKRTTTVSLLRIIFSNVSILYTARGTHHITGRIIFRSLSNDLSYVATTKKIISTMRNFTLQIKIIISMDALHMCGIC